MVGAVSGPMRAAAKSARLGLVHGLLFALALHAPSPGAAQTPQPAALRLAVAAVGGLVLCGTWPHYARRIERALGIGIDTVSVGNKEVVVPAFEEGRATLLLIHGSDASFALLAKGAAAPLRAWGANEHVIVGPPDDPAKVGDASSAVDAMRRIAAARAPFVAFRDPGSHSVVEGLWREGGVRAGAWVLPDRSGKSQEILLQAAGQRAYAVVGRIPVAFNKMPHGDLKVLLSGDPDMRRVYVAIEPGAGHPAAQQQRMLAKRVVDYMVSPAGQADLRAADKEAGGPWIYPLP